MRAPSPPSSTGTKMPSRRWARIAVNASDGKRASLSAAAACAAATRRRSLRPALDVLGERKNLTGAVAPGRPVRVSTVDRRRCAATIGSRIDECHDMSLPVASIRAKLSDRTG